MSEEAHRKGSVLQYCRTEEVRARAMSCTNGDKCNETTACRFWPLKKGVPSDEEIARLADNIKQDWKRLGAALGVKEKYLNQIEIDNPNDVYERALAVLQKWKTKQGRKATYDKLAGALHDQLVQRPGLVKAFSTDGEDNNVWILKAGSPTDEELLDLAQEIPQDWKRIGRAVGLKEKHLKIIEINNEHDVCERALATLFKWKEKQGQEATYAKLAAALDDDLVQRRDLVETFCCQVYPKPVDVNSNQDRTDQSPQEKSSTFQETLYTWRKRESVRGTTERTPSWRIRQTEMTSASKEELALREEIDRLKGTMESAMEKMDEILRRVQNVSTTAKKSPMVLRRQKRVANEDEFCEEENSFSSGIKSERAAHNESMTNTKVELGREIYQADKEINMDMSKTKDESSKETFRKSNLHDEFPNPLHLEFSNASRWVKWRQGGRRRTIL